jgi:hypothetical protein
MAYLTDNRHELYEAAMAAFSAAQVLAAKNPKPASLAWAVGKRWSQKRSPRT